MPTNLLRRRSPHLRLATAEDRPDPRAEAERELTAWRDEYYRLAARENGEDYADRVALADIGLIGSLAMAMILHASAGRSSIPFHAEHAAKIIDGIQWKPPAAFDARLYRAELIDLADDASDPADYLARLPQTTAIEGALSVEALNVLTAEIRARRV